MSVKSAVEEHDFLNSSGPLSKSVQLKAIELANAKVLKVKDGASSTCQAIILSPAQRFTVLVSHLLLMDYNSIFVHVIKVYKGANMLGYALPYTANLSIFYARDV